MQESRILSLFAKILNKLIRYYKNSKLYDLLLRSSRLWVQVLEGSKAVQFILRDWKEQVYWTNSLVYKLVALPVKIIKGISKRVERPLEHSIKGSLILDCINDLLANLFNISSRVFGLMLLAFTITEGVLWILFEINTVQGIMLRALLFLTALLLIFLNRSVKVLYTGSKVAKWVGSLFIAESKS